MGYMKSIVTDAHTTKITWPDGNVSTYHFIWLRDNCSCEKCGSHNSGSRFQSLLDIPVDIAPSSYIR